MSRKITLTAIIFVSLLLASTFLLVGCVNAQTALGSSQSSSGSSSYKMTVSYQIQDEGSPLAPKINYVDPNGQSHSHTIPLYPDTFLATMGKNKAWSVTPNPLGGSTSSERWYSIDSLSGKSPNNGGSAKVTFIFQHQYKIAFTVNPHNSGTTSPSDTQWYNSGQTINLVATKKDSYTFSSWTQTSPNTIKDTSTSTTTATIKGPGTITANFAKPQDTDLTVSVYPKIINKFGDQVTTITGKLTSNCKGVPGQSIVLMYNSGTGYNKITTVTTDSSGSYKFDWNPKDTLPNGQYVIKATFAGDSNYKANSAVTSCRGDITVVPEYLYGGLAALGACFIALATFKKRNSLPHFKHL